MLKRMMMREIWLWPQLGSLGSVLASMMFAYAMFHRHFPYQLRSHIRRYTLKWFGYLYPYIQISFDEYAGELHKRSEVFTAIQSYLSTKSSTEAKRLKAKEVKGSKSLVLVMDDNEEVTDEFQGIKLWWASRKSAPRQSSSFPFYPQSDEKRRYKLTFHRRHRDIITGSYLDHVRKEGKAIVVSHRQRKLYINNPASGYKTRKWSSVAFDHPATLESIAMEPKKKEKIIDDLKKFSNGKEYYTNIGKPWKRGYLLYGPPGTGQRKKKKEKDEEDKEKKHPTRKMREGEERKASQVTLSGLLNFIDGIWSACGGERIIVFTTNYVEKLDPALIRRGRMDKHIKLSYCCYEAFKVLARNYLNLDSHELFGSIERLLGETNMTPADVAENLMPKSNVEDAISCLKKLIEALEIAKEEARVKAEEEASKKAVKDAKVKSKKEAKLKAEKAEEKTEESAEDKEKCIGTSAK